MQCARGLDPGLTHVPIPGSDLGFVFDIGTSGIFKTRGKLGYSQHTSQYLNPKSLDILYASPQKIAVM